MQLRDLGATSAAVVLLSGFALAAPRGQLAFIGAKGAQIWHLPGGKIQALPRSARTDTFAFSPRGTAVFFVPPRQKPNAMARANPHAAYLSRPPYAVSRPIAALPDSDIYSFLWNRGQDHLYLSGYQLNGVYSPATGALRRLPFFPDSFDARGEKAGYSTEANIIVRDMKSGQERVLFSTKHPQPLFDALRRAKNPKKVADLLAGESAEKSEVSPWQLAGPALSPDGQRAYFVTNAGTGYGAAGNATQGFFACDLSSGKISVLSRVAPLLGRPPELSVSPDGRRLLAVSSVHSSAADNSSVALVIDLQTQNSRELLFKMPGANKGANFFGGSAWSPDGKYLALSAYFYDANKAMKPDGDWQEPAAADWKTAIFEAGTGKIWSVKTGMRVPSWSR